WTPRDNLAHLSAWRERAAQLLEAAAGGGPVDARWAEFQNANQRIFEENRGRSADEVRASAAASWDRLEGALQASSDELLQGPRPDRPEAPVWQIVPANAWEHLAEHLGYLREETGDLAGRDAAAEWGHE